MTINDTPKKNLTVAIEKHVPFVTGLLEPYANVKYLDTDEFTRENLRDVNAMIIRSRTVCDENLLAGTKVNFIVTATVGMDHIDKSYCDSHGIATINTPGCNAPAVAQYVLACMALMANRSLEQYTVGIVGVGHIGSIVERWCRALGMEVMLCDPPRQRAEDPEGKSGIWHTLEDITGKCDIVTFHTPLEMDGPDATFHLADGRFFNCCKRAPLFINASRGPVVDTESLIQALERGLVSRAAIDTWENEPQISRRLLDLTAIATTHIAGWSHEGKVRASQMAIDALTAFYFLPRITLSVASVKGAAKTVTPTGVLKSFNPLPMTQLLKNSPEDFEKIRNSYTYRSEAPDQSPVF